MTHEEATDMIVEIESSIYRLTPWEDIVVDTIKAMITKKIVLTPVEHRKLWSILNKVRRCEV